MIYNLNELMFDPDNMLLTIKMYPTEGTERKLHTHQIRIKGLAYQHPRDRVGLEQALKLLLDTVSNVPTRKLPTV